MFNQCLSLKKARTLTIVCFIYFQNILFVGNYKTRIFNIVSPITEKEKKISKKKFNIKQLKIS